MNSRLRRLLAASLALGLGMLVGAAQVQPREAKGVVFHDKNQNGQHEPDEEGISDVRVSNGREIVKTDREGRWKLPITDDTRLFVIKPRGWMNPVSSDKLPQFYYIHKPGGSPQSKFPGVSPTGPLPASIDFPLNPQQEPSEFRMVLFGDPQPRDQKEIDYIAHDVVESLVGVDASFGMSLGDIMFDDLSLFSSLNRVVAHIGIPWYNILGNHDINLDAPDDERSDETWERIYGPPYYSFDWGNVHFVCLDNVNWIGPQGDQRGRYTAGIGERQLEWLTRDLELTPKNQLVVVGMHIPIQQVAEKEQIFRLLEQRPFALSLSAHTHWQEHTFLTEKDGWRGKEPHHHVIHATVCGSWWGGAPDERGIPHTTMADGGPNGHSIVTFDGNKYKFQFFPAGRPADEQMAIWAPEEVASADTGTVEVLANIFFGSEKSKAEMRMNDSGPWLPMERIARADPFYEATKAREAALTPPPGRALPNPRQTQHMWKVMLPASLPQGTHRIVIRTTDMWNQTYTQNRTIRVK